MKVISEIALRNFEFWSGGADRAQNCTDEDFDSIEGMFEELYPDGMTDTEINDFFWFEFDAIAEHLGYEDEEDFDRKRDPDYIDDDELEDCVEDWWANYIEGVLDSDGEEGLEYIIEEIFGDDLEDIEEEFPQNMEHSSAYRYLTEKWDSSDLMEYLFNDDTGSDLLDDFPTKEELRSQLMSIKKANNE